MKLLTENKQILLKIKNVITSENCYFVRLLTILFKDKHQESQMSSLVQINLLV